MGRILIIDDEPIYLEGHIDALKEGGYQVDIAEDAEEAFKILKQSSLPTLIILDLIIPDNSNQVSFSNNLSYSGISLLKRLRTELGISVPVIILSVIADPTIHEKIALIEWKADKKAIIRVKPYLPSELLEDVNQLVTSY